MRAFPDTSNLRWKIIIRTVSTNIINHLIQEIVAMLDEIEDEAEIELFASVHID